jgi:hypothetical protein
MPFLSDVLQKKNTIPGTVLRNAVCSSFYWSLKFKSRTRLSVTQRFALIGTIEKARPGCLRGSIMRQAQPYCIRSR